MCKVHIGIKIGIRKTAFSLKCFFLELVEFNTPLVFIIGFIIIVLCFIIIVFIWIIKLKIQTCMFSKNHVSKMFHSDSAFLTLVDQFLFYFSGSFTMLYFSGSFTMFYFSGSFTLFYCSGSFTMLV